MEKLEVANEILRQIGGSGRLSAMIGAHSFVGGENSLSFQFKARAKNSIKAVRITLNAMDLYDVEFIKIRAGKVSVFKTSEGIYNDNLKSAIENNLGLYLSL